MNKLKNSFWQIHSAYRIGWIDTAKLIGVYLVILGHLQLKNPFLVHFIYLFHMPLFFFLGGLVEKNRSVKETVCRSLRNLAIPYVSFYLVTYVWWLATSFWRHPEMFEQLFLGGFVKPLLGMFVACGFTTRWSYMVNIPLWFLPALFWCRIFNAVGNKRAFLKPLICLAGMCIAIFLWKFDRFVPFSFGSACMAFPFYYAGTLFHSCADVKSGFSDVQKMMIKSAVFITSTALTVLFAYLNGRIDVNGVEFGKNPALFFCGAVAGIMMICSLSMLLPKLRAFGSFLAENTLVIFAFHTILLAIVRRIYIFIFLKGFSLDAPLPLLHAAIISLAVLFASFIPCVMVRKCFPFMLGLG